MTDSTNAEDITPEGSVAPIFLDPTPEVVGETMPDIAELAESTVAARQAGMAKLMALGLTEEEARVIVGA